jgi:hypothetical protein
MRRLLYAVAGGRKIKKVRYCHLQVNFESCDMSLVLVPLVLSLPTCLFFNKKKTVVLNDCKTGVLSTVRMVFLRLNA